MPNPPAEMKTLLILAKNYWKTEIKIFPEALFYMKTRAFLEYFVSDCLCKHFFASNLPQAYSNLLSLTILVTLKPFK